VIFVVFVVPVLVIFVVARMHSTPGPAFEKATAVPGV